MDGDNTTISAITDKVSARVRNALGKRLREIILYGSYARGDFDDSSDIDVMVLADVSDCSVLQKMEKTLWGIGWDVGIEHDIMISLHLKDYRHFYEWMDAIAYYRNVVKDGEVLYGA